MPRRRRLPVTERMRANGEVWTRRSRTTTSAPRSRSSATRASPSVAVAFMNAYANPAHELAAEAAAARRTASTGEICLSHRVSGEYREYERTCTTVIDAYVAAADDPLPPSARRAPARTRASRARTIVTRSGGGAMTFAEAEDRPFETIMSGPVAGAEGARRARPAARPRRRDHRRRRRHELRHLPRHRRPRAPDVPGRRSRACRCRRRGSTSARSAPAAARSRTSTSAACSRSARPARAPCPGPPATAAAARCRPSPTRRSCSGCSARGSSRAASALDRDAAEAALAPLAERLGFTVEEVGARDHDDRRREHGERDPRDHDRARPGSARRRS